MPAISSTAAGRGSNAVQAHNPTPPGQSAPPRLHACARRKPPAVPYNTKLAEIKWAHAPDMRDTMAPSLARVKAPRARVTDSTVGMAAGEQGATVGSVQTQGLKCAELGIQRARKGGRMQGQIQAACCSAAQPTDSMQPPQPAAARSPMGMPPTTMTSMLVRVGQPPAGR